MLSRQTADPLPFFILRYELWILCNGLGKLKKEWFYNFGLNFYPDCRKYMVSQHQRQRVKKTAEEALKFEQISHTV